MTEQHEQFWEARRELSHIRKFARARQASPWATLGVALARAVATVPPTVVLPPTVGTVASLNLMVAVVARSGGGKGAATGAARDAITFQDDSGIEIAVPVFPVGSGEGIARTFNPGADDPIERALFSVTEVDTLSALGARTGATIMPTLRQVFSGETLGHQNAQKATRVVVPEHTYRASVVVGVQELRAGPLIEDVAGGTPQRFVWLPAADPAAPERPPACPAEWVVKAPRWQHGQQHLVIPDMARNEITASRRRDLLGQSDPRDGHLMLTRLKVAAALMVMSGRMTITDEDWQLAETVMQVSLNTRSRIETVLAENTRNANRARAHAAADRDDIVSDRKVQRAKEAILRWLAKGEMAGSEIRLKLKTDIRPDFAPAVAELVEDSRVIASDTARGTRYRLKPAGTGVPPGQGMFPQVSDPVPPGTGVPTSSTGTVQGVPPVYGSFSQVKEGVPEVHPVPPADPRCPTHPAVRLAPNGTCFECMITRRGWSA